MFSITSVATLCTVSYVIYKYIIHPAFISPLSKIPNAHPTSPFSPLWILIKRFAQQENRTIHAAHVKYGDIVRLGPNEISVNCVDDGIRTIYTGGFEKWPWYNQFDNFGYRKLPSPISIRTVLAEHPKAASHVCFPPLKANRTRTADASSPTSTRNPTSNPP